MQYALKTGFKNSNYWIYTDACSTRVTVKYWDANNVIFVVVVVVKPAFFAGTLKGFQVNL